MSEPLSSFEIEDVLSSIRRLVSEDMRPAPRGASPLRAEPIRADLGRLDLARSEADRMENGRNGNGRGTTVLGDKLILTPALRVVQDETAAISDVVATLGAKVAEAPQEWESETGDVGPAALQVKGADAALNWAEEVQSEAPETQFAGRTDEAVADDTVVAVSDVGTAEDLAAAAVSDGESLAEVEFIPAASEGAVPGWAQTATVEDEDSPRPDPWMDATVEPDAAWADAAEAEALRELQAAPVSDVPDDAVMDEMRFEEEVLRELVRDIIREELQGRLGERITRNIRKLVRAEVAQALAARDLS